MMKRILFVGVVAALAPGCLSRYAPIRLAAAPVLECPEEAIGIAPKAGLYRAECSGRYAFCDSAQGAWSCQRFYLTCEEPPVKHLASTEDGEAPEDEAEPSCAQCAEALQELRLLVFAGTK